MLICAVACLLISLLDACHTGRKGVSKKSSKDPKFITGVYIDPHRSGAEANTINRSGKTAKHGKQVIPPVVANNKSKPKQPVNKITDPKLIIKKYALLLGVKPKDLDNLMLYKFIENWFGATYRFGGTEKSGIDCSAFAQKLYADVYGIDLVRTATEQFSSCKRITTKKAIEGDLVFFSIESNRITHVGIYLANYFFVHASASGGVMISSLNEDYWGRYYAGIGRVPRG